MSIFNLGTTISSMLGEDGITEKAELYVYVNEDEFHRVDEDLFYRNKKNDGDEFVPSEGEIRINFDKVVIVVKRKKK